MSSSPRMRKMPPRPKILLPVPGQYYPHPQTATGMGYVPTPYGQTPVPMTPVAGQPQIFYSNRASEFVFTQFKGIKDLTKSGLSVGEKSAFWLYEKVRSWSKKWFTHIFLFVVILLYSIIGAIIFVTVEGSIEKVAVSNIRQKRNDTADTILGLCEDSVLASDMSRWRGAAAKEIMEYEKYLYEYFGRGLKDKGEEVWTFWNAVFYCGTIYTTIGHRVKGLSDSDGAVQPPSWAIEWVAVVQARRRDAKAMEDSYIVHRRRKAAARKREKTPDPSSRGAASHIDASDDEDEERRAKMERMAEEAEKMEQQQKENRLSQHQKQEVSLKELENKDKMGNDLEQRPARRKNKTDARNVSANVDDMIAVHAEVAVKSTAGNTLKTRETDSVTTNNNSTQPVKQITEVAKKFDDGTTKKDVIRPAIVQAVKDSAVQETSETPKETNGETSKPVEIRKVERRLKRRSKERVERYSRSTDSSDEKDEKDESSRKRTKSPETVKSRVKKTSGKSRISDPEAQKKDTEILNREKRSPSRQKFEDESRTRDDSVPHSRPYNQTEDMNEDLKIVKKSESLSQKFAEERRVKRSSVEMKKQIIPLSNESLIEDFARAQREYMLRERSILDPEVDMFQDAVEVSYLRKRKLNLTYTESEQEDIVQNITQSSDVADKKKSWFSWLSFWHGKKDENIIEKKTEDIPNPASKVEEIKVEKEEAAEKITLLDFFRALRDVVSEFKTFVAQNPRETTIIRRLRNRCIAGLLLIIIYCGLGGFVFRFVEGAFETFYKCGVKRVKRDFLDTLWNYSHNLREDDWKSMARRKLMEFEEQLHTAHEAGLHTYSGQKSWSFLNAVVYCLTVITTIGYGHISPSTDTGRAITIVYAIFGIPMFLIILADFGKLFTRGIKFLWAFVRRLYYTGSCRKVRRTGPVQEVMKGVQLVYDLAKLRRPSQMIPEEIDEMQRQQIQQPQTILNVDANTPGTPGTPALSAYIVDDEFNLPISVAIVILLAYIFIGATLYSLWESWNFFESFYFVFISMSTIGFGDYVPKHPIYMMGSIVYLVFGLALTSMCINVVQVMLSDSFKQASQKIGATIGFEVAEDDNSVKPAPPPPVEVADVHISVKESESDEKIAPKAKQEDINL
ncbi:TWiK family of potassium channels protein 18 [Trachymyrmex septentrionalis]|uniref:TWiK family of potassium channels protein 18 n=1 Tax=Trachymyrmex septentrionalis TaxID=34720 RepID=A0A195FGR6_9HYME|nr:TWiK family of potassium channels protein 18 [Trachymyrmex septentrionalis]